MYNPLTISIKINNVLLNEDNSAVRSFLLEESITTEFPKLSMTVSLRNEFLTEKPLIDGSPIEITISSETSSRPDEVCRFRLYHFDAVSSTDGGSLEYSITAYHEALWLLSRMEDSAYTMSSSEVFKRIAIKTNLADPEIDQTNDYMTWFTLEGNRLNFMRDVCLHSWSNKYSVFAWWVSRTGSLHFKNLVSRIQEIPSCRLKETLDLTKENDSCRPVTNVSYTVESSINNFKYGYGRKLLYFDTLEMESNVLYPREFQSNVQSLNVSEVGSTQGWISSGISSGNVHQNYQRAEIQNRRGLALWSTVISCVDQYCCNFDIGDCVEFVFQIDARNDSLLYSGNYLVSGIQLVIDTTNKPVKKLFLVRQGISTPVLEESNGL